MSTVVVTLPDGSTREVESGTTPLQIAMAIGPRLAKATLAAKIDDKEVDVYFPITKNSKLQLITNNAKDKDGLEVIRHSTAHLLAMAIKELYPAAQITIGPVIEDGFYYDIDCPKALTPEDLPTIEKKMAEIAARKLDVTRDDGRGAGQWQLRHHARRGLRLLPSPPPLPRPAGWPGTCR